MKDKLGQLLFAAKDALDAANDLLNGTNEYQSAFLHIQKSLHECNESIDSLCGAKTKAWKALEASLDESRAALRAEIGVGR